MPKEPEEQFELFQRVRPTQVQVPWDLVLKFKPDGAKSATQRAIEKLGMLQGVCLRIVTVEVAKTPRITKGDAWYTDQFNVVQPAICFTTGEPFPPGVKVYEILDGRRRGLDSYNANDEALAGMCFPEDANERTVAAAAAVLNIARKPNPLQEAQSLQRLLDLKMDREQIADTLGIPLQTLKKRLRLLQLPPVFQTGIAEGNIKPGVAERIANLTSKQVDRLKKVLAKKGSIRGTDVKAVQEVHKSADLSRLGDQLSIGFQVDPSGYEAAMDQAGDTAEAMLLKAAEVLFRDGTSFTHIRTILSTLNHQIKQENAES